MSCKELIESLRKAADERVKGLWAEAEAEAGRVRSDAAGRIEQMRQDNARKQRLLAGDQAARARSEANRRARVISLSAEKGLSDRLYESAVALLPSLRKQRYEAVFAAFARELPPLAWQAVRVNPGDAALAKKHFPGAEIATDAKITGGMDVSAGGGAIRVINTFEKRLERAWGDLQPELIRDAYREVNGESSASATRGPGISGGIPAGEDQGQAVAADL